MKCRLRLWFVLPLLLLPTSGQGQDEHAPLALGVEEQVSAEAVVLPLVVATRKEKFASDCAEIARGLGRDDLMVLEGGEEVRILDVVRERLATCFFSIPARIATVLRATISIVHERLPGRCIIRPVRHGIFPRTS